MPLIHSKQCKTEAPTKRCIRLKGYYQITKIPVSWSIVLFVRTSNKDHPKEMFSLSKTAKKFSFSGFINLLLCTTHGLLLWGLILVRDYTVYNTY